MSAKKTFFISLVVIAGIIWTFVLFMVSGGIYLLPSETFGPAPEIQYAEFPFKLEYKVNEDTFVVEDVLVGEFVKNTYHIGLGKIERVWKARFKSGNKYITLYLDDEKEVIYQPIADRDIIGTFMGEKTVYNVEVLMSRPVSLRIIEGGDERFTSVEELKNTFNIQLISWEIAPPIENEFAN